MDQSFMLLFKNKIIPIPRDIEFLEMVSRNIQSELIKNQEYIVQSEVSNDCFHIFLDYWLKNIIPSFNTNNTYEIDLLIEEFGLKKHIKTRKYDNLLKISIIKSSFSYYHDKSKSEEYISINLDYYLKNYSIELYNIPIASLNNIFLNEKRVLNDHSLAYSFIVNCKEKTYIYTLLRSIDADKLPTKLVWDSIKNRDIHFGFSLKNESLFLEKIDSQNQKLKKTNNDLYIENTNLKNDFQQSIKKDQIMQEKNETILKMQNTIDIQYKEQKKQCLQIEKLHSIIEQQKQENYLLQKKDQQLQKFQLQSVKKDEIIQQQKSQILRLQNYLNQRDDIIQQKDQDILHMQNIIQQQQKENEMSNSLYYKTQMWLNIFSNSLKNAYSNLISFLVSKTFLWLSIIIFIGLILFIIFNKTIIAQFYMLLASLNILDYIILYANCLYDGVGIQENKLESSKYYKIAADKGHIISMLKYADMLFYEDGISRNKTEYLKYYKMAADNGNLESIIKYYKSIYNVNKTETIKYIKMAIDYNDVESIYNYAEMRYNDTNIGINRTEARYLFKKAADKGHVKSMVIYADMLYYGNSDFPKNHEIAINYYINAAKKLDGKAMMMYARMLYYGEATNKDLKKSLYYYKNAIQHGYNVEDSEYKLLLKKEEDEKLEEKNKDNLGIYLFLFATSFLLFVMIKVQIQYI